MTVQPVVVPRRWPRRAAYAGVASLAVLLPTSTAGATWFLASQVLNAVGLRQYPVRVRNTSDRRVALAKTPDTARGIPLSFIWPDGHAQLGGVVSQDRSTVVREVTEVTRGTLQPGIRGYTSSYIFDGDPQSARGLDFVDVNVPSGLGDLPAWLVPPTTAPVSDTWIIAVHGRGAPRGEALRVLPTLAASGHPTLVVTYRNDEGAPSSTDRRFHLGDTEWEDVLAATEFARSNGAKGIILYGWSMGGAIVLTLLRRWQHAGFVRGAILDCPVVDWIATLQMNARALAVPSAWTWSTMRLIERQLRVRLSELDQRTFAASLDVPTLLFVDHDDATVAPWPSLEFAATRPDLVQLVETRGAGHCRSWNLDPAAYEASVTSFLHSLSR
jgi:pimeloyl-ACP methyl ester carboxylesterase